MKHSFALLGLASSTLAYPFALEDVAKQQKRQVPSLEAARALSKARTNCGNIPCLTFDAKEQYVSVEGDHAYAAPGADEIRGPCPGLNAAANHGYLSRTGVTTLAETVEGLASAFGMGPGLSSFLAVYAILFNGDPVLGTWSIGGPPPTDTLTSGLLGQPQGITWSHNTYESDKSIGRFDAYTNHGDAHSLDVSRFAASYKTCMQPDGSVRCTMDGLAEDFSNKGKQSVATNPYFFSAPFSGVIVAPAAYFFVINLMSNHTEEEKSGYLDGDTFKQFFAVKGEYPNFTWEKGQERIPENWYRRPLAFSYDIPNADSDVGVQYAAFPDSFHLGGNQGTVNSYAGVDLEDFTGGAMGLADLANGKASCFYAQLAQSLIPDSANLLLSELSPITDLVNKAIKPLINADCPIVDKFDQSLFNKFPGYKYSPTGSDH